MTGWFRAVAVDFDGTLVQGDHPPCAEVLAAVGECRRRGQRVVLVTGRILEELRAVFPGVDHGFDAIVGENGAVLASHGAVRVLAAPVEVELDAALLERGIPFRRGQVLLATQAAHEAAVTRELRQLGLECQLIRNRAELMVLPPGVSKGFGVYQALGELGISHHSAVGLGDAENDHSLLRTCEVGVAVADAVPSLQRQADLVLEEPGPSAVAEFLRGPVLTGEQRVEPRRWQIELGRTEQGDRVRIPASQVNVLIVGRSGSGKSFLAGILAEQLLGLGYSLCLVDPQGDYAPLGRLRGMLKLGGREALPQAEQVGRFVEHRFGSVLLDLSMSDRDTQERYVPPLLAQLEAERRATGLPHWIFLDEAHHLRPLDGETPPSRGYCLVTYRPHELTEAVRERIDVILALPGGKLPERSERCPLEAVEEAWGLDFGSWRHAASGQVLIARPKLGGQVRAFRMGRRRTRHVRHWHKYFGAELPPELHFVFRSESQASRHVGTNMGEFHRILLACDPELVRYHAARRDFSRWVRQAIQDMALGGAVGEKERTFLEGAQDDEDVEVLRRGVVRAIEDRYVDAWADTSAGDDG